MSTFIGRKAPDFTSPTIMPDNSFAAEFTLSRYLAGKMGVLLFYPMNFGFVEPTELLGVQKRLMEFRQRATEVIAISTDTHLSHLEWKSRPAHDGGLGGVQFPMVSDITRRIAQGYDVLLNDSMAARATFVIDRQGFVRYQAVYDLPFGRNIDEIIRVLDAMLTYEQQGMVMPEGWQRGDRPLNPTRDATTQYIREQILAA